MYVGEIEGLIPGHRLPLTVLSLPDYAAGADDSEAVAAPSRRIVVIVGQDGWTPAQVALNADTITENNGIKVRSNGFVISMVSESDPSLRQSQSEVHGAFTNLITQETGRWKVRPVR